MTLPRLALDWDDVVVDFNAAAFSFLNSRYTIGRSPDSLQTPTTLLANKWGKKRLSVHESQAFYRAIDTYIEEDFSRCPFVLGARERIQKLAEHYELVILTARSQDRTHHISNFLAHHNLLEPIYAVYGSTLEKLSKPAHAKELGAVALVDDLPSNLIGCVENQIRPILFERPWSDLCTDAHGNTLEYSGARVRNWEELVQLLI